MIKLMLRRGIKQALIYFDPSKDTDCGEPLDLQNNITARLKLEKNTPTKVALSLN